MCNACTVVVQYPTNNGGYHMETAQATNERNDQGAVEGIEPEALQRKLNIETLVTVGITAVGILAATGLAWALGRVFP